MASKREWKAMKNLEEKIMKRNAFYISPYNVIASPCERAFTVIRDC